MGRWLIMFGVGIGMAITILLQKHQLNRGVGWPSVSMSHNMGVWFSLTFILSTLLVSGNKIHLDSLSLIGGVITGVTSVVSIWYLANHTAGETMIAIRATASVSVLLFGYFLLGESPTIKQWIGFALVIIGTLLL